MSKHGPKPQSSQHAQEAASDPPRLGWAARLIMWCLAHTWVVLACASLVTASMALGAFLIVGRISDALPIGPDHDIQLALDHLDEGRPIRAREMAESLQSGHALTTTQRATLEFITGASAAAEASEIWDELYRSKFYLVAARYLQGARELGFPKEREGEGLFLLSQSLFGSGQYDQCLPVLVEALDALPKQQLAILDMLIQCNQRLAQPDFQQALQWIDRKLSHKDLAPFARQQTLFDKGRVLFEMGQFDEADGLLANVPDASATYPDALLLRGQILLRAGDLAVTPANTATAEQWTVARGHYQSAYDMFHQITERGGSWQERIRAARYLIGVVLRKLGKLDEASKELSTVRRVYHGTSEGLMAGLEQAEILQQIGQDRESADLYQTTLNDLGDPHAHSSRWISAESIRRRVRSALEGFLSAGHYELATLLAEHSSPLFPVEKSLQFTADARVAWADALMRQSTGELVTTADETQTQARDQWRLAGHLYADLSRRIYGDPGYIDQLWKSANCFLKGHDYEAGVAAFQDYLNNEFRRHRADAMVGLGQCWLGLAEPVRALTALEECIEYHPKDPLIFRARLLAATAYQELSPQEWEVMVANETDVAKTRKNAASDPTNLEELLNNAPGTARAAHLLQTNLYQGELEPDSPEWRDTLFALGELVYRQAVAELTRGQLLGHSSESAETAREAIVAMQPGHAAFLKSIPLLREAVRRYPQATQSMTARYHLAQAYRRAAILPARQIALEKIDTVRADLRKQQRESLTSALNEFRELQFLLNEKRERSGLTPLESDMLRNTYFTQGEGLFDLGEYEEAIKAYSTATSRYQQSPESLEAYVQVFMCYLRLGMPLEARGTVEQAKVVLTRIPEDRSFQASTRYSRDEWGAVLDGLSKL